MHQALGEGTYGSVFLATAPPVAVPFAAKMLKHGVSQREDKAASMAMEATVQAALGAHPCIAQVRWPRLCKLLISGTLWELATGQRTWLGIDLLTHWCWSDFFVSLHGVNDLVDATTSLR